jgi:glycosyltransferase involved in cell wall biosynthesis
MFHPSPSSTPSNLSNNYTVINPRGMRAYVQNEAFFKAIPRVLKAEPMTQFLFPAMEAESQAERWRVELDIVHAVELMPPQGRAQMADLFRQAQVTVSPSIHDGTPNTLLEAMACGCFPVVGDLESIREWITPGVNGLLANPNDPRALAEAILLALRTPNLRARAQVYNTRLVSKRAEYSRVMGEAERFYERLM